MASGGITPDSLRELVESRDTNASAERLRSLRGAEGIAQQLGSNAKTGLSDERALQNKEHFGRNEYPTKPTKTFLRLFLETLNDRTLIILIIAAVVNIALGMTTENIRTGWIDGTAILAAVLVVATVTAANDYSKERQFQELNRVVESRKVSVMRNSRQTQIDIKDITVGDVVLIATGDSLPADGLVLEAAELHVDESSMTGESEAAVKSLQEDPYLLANTKVMAGTGRMLVVAVGTQSQWGRLKAMLDQPSEQTPLQIKLDALAERIGLVGVAAAVLTFGLLLTLWLARNYYIGQKAWKWSQLIEVNRFFLAGVSLIVIAVPEGLPLAVTMSLAYSMRRMMKDNCLVRRLEACETMGGATQICSDKTGTLTQNRMTVVRLFVGGQTLDLSGAQVPQLSESFRSAFGEGAAANSTATLELNPESKQKEAMGSKTEGALLLMLDRYQIDYEAVRSKAEIVKRYPFSSDSKRMGTIVRTSAGTRFYCTGAGEIVSKFCTRCMTLDGNQRPLDAAQVNGAMRQFAADGLRVVALAMSEAAGGNAGDAPEHDLTLVALVGIKDPVRPDVPAAVRRCQAAGVTVRMLTGDNKLTAAHIATECGVLPRGAVGDGVVMEGSEFRALPDPQLLSAVRNLRVLARASPQDKHRLVRALRASGEVVAVTGDGTNDAPQLKEADVGFSMGITGTEVAKEASDIVLLDDNFASIVNAIKWGRNVYDSIRKFLQFQLTVTTVAIILSVVGSVLWDESPLSPIQMLWVNLIMDTFASLALATEAPTEKLLDRPPYGRTEPTITRKMWRFIVGSAVLQLTVVFFFLYAAQLVPWFGLPKRTSTWNDHHYRVRGTIVFNTFVWLQLFNLFHARKLEDELNIFTGLFSNWVFWAVVVFTAGAQVVIVQFGGGPASTTGLTLMQWLGCLAAGSLSFFWGFLLRLIPIRNVVAARESARDEEKEPLLPPRKSRSIVDIDPPKKVVAVNDAPEDVRANAHAAWHRLRQRTSIIATLRRKRA